MVYSFSCNRSWLSLYEICGDMFKQNSASLEVPYSEDCMWTMAAYVTGINVLPLNTQNNMRHDNAYFMGCIVCAVLTQIASFMGPTWGPSGACRTQVGPMLTTWTLLSGYKALRWRRSNLFFYLYYLSTGLLVVVPLIKFGTLLACVDTYANVYRCNKIYPEFGCFRPFFSSI